MTVCIHLLDKQQKQQVASMTMVAEPELTLSFIDVQMQAGGSDCGVFALAFATAVLVIHWASFSSTNSK